MMCTETIVNMREDRVEKQVKPWARKRHLNIGSCLQDLFLMSKNCVI